MNIKIKLQIADHDVELTIDQLQELRAELDKLLTPRPNLQTYTQLLGSLHSQPPKELTTYPNNPITCATQFHPN